jgi:hypothetical protein
MTPTMTDLTVLVNTSDGYADCWDPFFRLFSDYWRNCPYPIVLNTETRDYAFAGLDITATKIASGASRRLSWSECLGRCLGTMSTPYVLYLQEDYFLESPVRGEWIENFLGVLRAGRADVIRLMECDGSGPWHPTADETLWAVDQKARYRIALQAGLWRKTTLQGSLRQHESAWQLEGFGSERARRRRGEIVLAAARDRFHGPGLEVFPYQPTGVIAGKWERSIVEPLFAAHAIEVDFSRRGFYDSTERLVKPPLRKRLADRVRSLL